jgi:hypothetical protein
VSVRYRYFFGFILFFFFSGVFLLAYLDNESFGYFVAGAFDAAPAQRQVRAIIIQERKAYKNTLSKFRTLKPKTMTGSEVDLSFNNLVFSFTN